MRRILLLIFFLSFSYAANPDVIFISQYPADVNNTNVINNPLIINYSINDTDGDLNYSSIRLYYKSNSTTSNIQFYLNGTAFQGYFVSANRTNTSTYNFTWTLLDNEIYPGVYNTGPVSIDNKLHIKNTTLNLNTYYITEYYNISNTTAANFFEIAANSTAGALPAHLYYCNSSYVSGNILTTPYCNQIGSRSAITTYDHCHTNASCHIAIPFTINTTSGRIGNITISTIGYFIFGGSRDWNVWNIAELTRIGMTKSTGNRGVAWTNQTYTIDQHLHQYNATADFSLYYYVCANDTANNQNCSDVRQDLFEVGNLPPSAPIVYNPTEATYEIGNITINYTASVSPNGYDIVYYNISLLNGDGTFNQTIQANNSINLSYIWDASAMPAGSYFIRVEAYDNLSQTRYGYSPMFNLTTVGTMAYPVLYFPPDNYTIITNNQVIMIFNYSCLGAFPSYDVNLSINSTAQILDTIDNGTSILRTLDNLTNGSYEWSVNCANGSYNGSTSRYLNISNISNATTTITYTTVANKGGLYNIASHKWLYLALIIIPIVLFLYLSRKRGDRINV